ncbi:hypothetical protein JCM3765_007802 [Sporobolomyces pararoseus]
MPTTYPPSPSTLPTPLSTPSSSSTSMISTSIAFSSAFFLFGTLNNVLYVVILSAALDLVDKATTPKGLILFVNIAPALIVKIGWPYLVPGKPRYKARVSSCSALSFSGILIVALSDRLFWRLFGISIASFSSGLGEMTFLQLSTIYGSLSTTGSDRDLGGKAVGWFSSGTGAAGLIGAGLWWCLRGFGVEKGLLICSFLPLCMALNYFLLLPSFNSFQKSTSSSSSETPYSTLTTLSDEDRNNNSDTSPLLEQHDQEEEEAEEEEENNDHVVERQMLKKKEDELPSLTMKEKFELAKPLFFRFMLPLFFVYLAEYTINSGVAPTLLYEIPNPKESPILSSIIKNLRDYYPLWQLLYQTFVFISRSSLSILNLPPLPLSLLPLPTILQLLILFSTILESTHQVFVRWFGENGAVWLTGGLVCCEGLCGGAAYVNCFYRLGTAIEEEEQQQSSSEEEGGRVVMKKDSRRKEQEKEFRIASVGFADTSGILVASLIASVLEPKLCQTQVRNGRTYCTQL